MAKASMPWLTDRRSTQRASRGSTHRPNAVAPARNKAMRAVSHTRPQKPPEPVVTARKIENTRMERISSTTAAPSRLRPTRERSTPNSIRVRAEILTLVAPSDTPSSRAALSFNPNSRPAPQPSPIDSSNPPTLPSRDARRWPANSPRCNSRPARNINNSTPSSLRSEMIVPSVELLIKGRPRILSSDGPSSTPTSSSPSTEGWPRRVLMYPAAFAAKRITTSSKASCRKGDMVWKSLS